MSNFKKNVLEAYWLRPETAFWRARDIQVINETNFKFEGKCLDMGGGDGIFSFLMNGGRLKTDYDSYSFTSNLDKHVTFSDIYDSEIKDISNLGDIVLEKTNKIDITNFDHKLNLLNKSKLLNFYSKFINGDANKILKIRNNTFDSIFSNIVYWINDTCQLLDELSRIGKPNSTLLFLVPNSRFLERSNLFKYRDFNFEKKFLEILDRGRYQSNITSVKTREEWIKILRNTNWNIIENKSYLSDDLINYWEIALRPFSPFLIDAFNKLKSEDRLTIKNNYVEDLYPVYEGFLNSQKELEEKNGSNFELFYCINKK